MKYYIIESDNIPEYVRIAKEQLEQGAFPVTDLVMMIGKGLFQIFMKEGV